MLERHDQVELVQIVDGDVGPFLRVLLHLFCLGVRALPREICASHVDALGHVVLGEAVRVVGTLGEIGHHRTVSVGVVVAERLVLKAAAVRVILGGVAAGQVLQWDVGRTDRAHLQLLLPLVIVEAARGFPIISFLRRPGDLALEPAHRLAKQRDRLEAVGLEGVDDAHVVVLELHKGAAHVDEALNVVRAVILLPAKLLSEGADLSGRAARLLRDSRVVILAPADGGIVGRRVIIVRDVASVAVAQLGKVLACGLICDQVLPTRAGGVVEAEPLRDRRASRMLGVHEHNLGHVLLAVLSRRH